MPVRYQPTRKKNKFIVRRGPNAKGLTKSQRDQVSKIAKKSVQTVAEKKFMDSQQYKNQDLVLANSDSPIAVMGYSTTVNTDPASAVVMYGLGAVNEGLCLRPFYHTHDRNDEFSQYAVDGKKVMPRKCQTMMRFVRRYDAVDNSGNYFPLSNPSGWSMEAPPSASDGIGKSLPMGFRMIRVTPKGAVGTNTQLIPSHNLFQDKFGNGTGVASTDFGENELRFFKINTRKWTVLEDKQWTMNSPLSLQWTFSRGNGLNSGWYIPQITNTNKNCEKIIRFNHQLTNRKNGSVHYNVINDAEMGEDPTNNSDSGQRREYVFIHAYYLGSTDLVAPDSTQKPQSPVGFIKWNLANTTTFTDV